MSPLRMNARRRALALLAASFAFAPRVVLAQRRPGPARVGWLSYLAPPDPGLEQLREGMRALGYVEGKSYVLIARFAGGDFNRLPEAVEELAAEHVDVLVARGPSADFTKAVRSRIPVVFMYSGDPVAAGFGDSLRKPGRNMTGITFMAMELSAKRVEVLNELVPRAARIALLSNPEHAGELSEYRVTEDTAARFGAATTRYLIRGPQELAPAFAAIRADKPDAMIVFPDSLTLARRKDIADFAALAGIPSMYGWTEFVESGGLLSYGPSITEHFQGLAVFVDKLLKGGDANTMPIEQASRIRLTLNLPAARALNLAIPQSLLVRADRTVG